MGVLGIDQSLSATGIYSTATDRGMTVAVGVLKEGARLAVIRDQVRDLLEIERPQLAVIEGYAFGGEHRHLQVAEIGGVLRLLFHERRQPYAVVPPTSLKLFATGDGRAEKKQMVTAARDRWGRIFRDHNQADAFWLAMVGAYLLMDPLRWLKEGLTLKQIETLRKVWANPFGEAVIR